MGRSGPMPTVNGYQFNQATSSLQKFIRRGMEREALYMAAEFERSGYGRYVWKRLRVISSEDVGLGWPEGPAVIRALYENYEQFREENNNPNKPGHRLFLIHAVLLLCRAKKSRLVDHATLAAYRWQQGPEVPDFAFDRHTAQGKRMGRGFDHFFDEGCKLENMADIEDIYEAEARELMAMQERGEIPAPVNFDAGQGKLPWSE